MVRKNKLSVCCIYKANILGVAQSVHYTEVVWVWLHLVLAF